MTAPTPPEVRYTDPAVPTVARIYNYLCGGTDHFTADRRAAEQILAAVPDARDRAQANRAFILRTVSAMAAAGIGQFIDVGAGLPHGPAVHQAARILVPDARVVYVDIDPVACTLWQTLLVGDDGAAAVMADAGDPEAILAHPEVRRLIRFIAPVGVLFGAVLPFLGAAAGPGVAAFRQRMGPGSMLALSHVTATGTPPKMAAEVQDICAAAGAGVTFRTRVQVGALFGDLALAAPGLVEVTKWPSPQPGAVTPALPILGGLARVRNR